MNPKKAQVWKLLLVGHLSGFGDFQYVAMTCSLQLIDCMDAITMPKKSEK